MMSSPSFLDRCLGAVHTHKTVGVVTDARICAACRRRTSTGQKLYRQKWPARCSPKPRRTPYVPFSVPLRFALGVPDDVLCCEPLSLFRVVSCSACLGRLPSGPPQHLWTPRA